MRMPRLDAMKLHFHPICLILLVLSSCSAPKPVTGIEKRRQQHLDVFLDLLRNNDAAGLAKLVHYPLSRSNPIPNVENEADFIRRYDTLLDSEFRKTLVQTNWDSTNTMERNG